MIKSFAWALALLSVVGCAAPAQQSSVDESPRMGALVARTGERGAGHATATLLSAIDSDASEDSGELDCRGYTRGGWVAVTFAGFAAGTNLVGSLEFMGGVDTTVANYRALPIDGTKTIPIEASLPTGMTIDAGDDGFDFADTFEANTTIYVPMQNLPPYLLARFTRTGGGADSATITVKAVVQQ